MDPRTPAQFDWMPNYQKEQALRAKRQDISPTFFIRGGEYKSRSMIPDTSITYHCVHADAEVVIFTFTYQGRKRVHHAYYADIKDGDYVVAK